MTMSVKMLMDIAIHAQEMAEAATAMAGAMKTVANDCAGQLAAKRAASTCADGGTASDPMSAPAGASECGIAANAQNGTQERVQTKYEGRYAQTAKDADNGIQ